MSPVSPGGRECEDQTSVDVKMFIPYDSAKLCINQVCRCYSWRTVLDVFFFVTPTKSKVITPDQRTEIHWLQRTMVLKLGSTTVCQKHCCLSKSLHQTCNQTKQSFWIEFCFLQFSHVSITPSVALREQGEDRAFIWYHVLLVHLGEKPIHDYTFLNSCLLTNP